MDIAEIRKKAQREREQGRGAVRPAFQSSPEETAVAPPAGGGDDAGVYDEFFPAEETGTYPSVAPVPPPLVRDPLSIILEGRRAALVADELPTDAGGGAAQEPATSLDVLCFRVADEIYGIDIMELKEIIKPRETTEVPHAPPFIVGVLSLRGIIIPVFVMRERLGLGGSPGRGKERIIVVKRGEGLCGILVDEVTQVVRINAASVEHPPAVLDGIDREFVSGIGRHDGGIIILLHLEKVLDAALL